MPDTAPLVPPASSRRDALAAAMFAPTERPARRRARRTPRRAHPWLRRAGASLLTILGGAGVALALNAFVIQSFVIPSESMLPTLAVGDRVLVSRLAPALSEIHRGDIVVFADSAGWLTATPGASSVEPSGLSRALAAVGAGVDPEKGYLIKRVIGLPGDTVAADGSGPMSVNGVVVDEPYLPSGVASSTQAFRVTVPTGCLWVMGDNRENSADSRAHITSAAGGYVPIRDVVGVAVITMFPTDRARSLGGAGTVFGAVPDPT